MSRMPENSVESLFLQATERGDRKAIIFALENAPDLNVNCTDADGNSALVVAIQNGNSDIVKLLLDHNIQLGDSLLRAVDAQFTPGVRLICDHIKKKNIPEALNCKALNGDFHPDVSPLVLAAQHNNFDTIKTLLEAGARIKDPRENLDQSEVHTLENSVGMLNLYKALASQSYISLTSSDPFNTTFELCAKMRKLMRTKYEFCDQFQELADQCEQFAADLLDQVRDSGEQAYILNHDSYGWGNPNSNSAAEQPNRVKAAIHFEQRKFVAHPHCQQRLIERWYAGLPGWRDMSSLRSGFLVFLMGLGFPLLSIAYIIYPRGRYRDFLSIPYVKFVCHTSSMIYFLLLLLYQTMAENQVRTETDTMTDGNGTTTATRAIDSRSDPPTITMLLIVAWVAGQTWQKCKELWYNGARFFVNLWNYFDFFMLSLFWSFIALRVMVYIQALAAENASFHIAPRSQDLNATLPPPTSASSMDTSVLNDNAVVTETLDGIQDNLQGIHDRLDQLGVGQSQIKSMFSADSGEGSSSRRRGSGGLAKTDITENEDFERANWGAYDPVLIAEALFAIAKVLSFLRPICITVVNRHVGPMQISLGGMIIDICKFLLIFCFVWFAFSLGMNQLYWYYSAFITTQPFGTLGETMATLFWALFGLPDMNIVNLSSQANIPHTFTQTVGNFLYATYHVISIVVLLNVLIAMMSNTYTRVEMDADIEWKFSRSKLWMSYFDDLGTVPPPFNIIPTPKAFFYFFRWLFCEVVCRGEMARAYKERLKSLVDERQLRFKEVSDHLVRRYHFEKRHQEEDDDQANILNELKQDISGFKFEMFEALGEMDKKIRQVEAKVHDKDLDDDGTLGTGMFQALRDAMKEPERRDSMCSVSSGCSVAMVDMAQAKTEKKPKWLDETELELQPLVPPVVTREESSTSPPNGIHANQLRFIDEDDALGTHRNTEA
ncbi:short transient receptor potential channel 5 [Strongylocentrotus purpuratus]|uniref:Transient receptor ion channel domain-containing protein n=1 Tax=Strongylocentrotus purpuratus TaxID=7668 RepID=A0A7M7PL58_STRPU|nr:short transient receptor potential channel 5 [Strongylocentrotus purpuratus]